MVNPIMDELHPVHEIEDPGSKRLQGGIGLHSGDWCGGIDHLMYNIGMLLVLLTTVCIWGDITPRDHYSIRIHTIDHSFLLYI